MNSTKTPIRGHGNMIQKGASYLVIKTILKGLRNELKMPIDGYYTEVDANVSIRLSVLMDGKWFEPKTRGNKGADEAKGLLEKAGEVDDRPVKGVAIYCNHGKHPDGLYAYYVNPDNTVQEIELYF